MVSRRLMAGIQWAVCSYLHRYWETQKEGQRTWADRLHTTWTHPTRQQRASFGSPSATEQRLEGEGRLQILPWIFHDVLLLFRDFCLLLSCPLSIAYAVHEGLDNEWLEPTAWQQEDAWRPHVSVHCDCWGQTHQHHCLHPRILPQSVSDFIILGWISR